MPDISEITSADSQSSQAKYPTLTPSSTINIQPLSNSNYPVWRSQIVPYFISQDVFGYLDGSIPPPPATLAGNNGVTKPNSEFHAWRKADSLILTTLSTSLTKDILDQVYDHETSADMWNAIKQLFSSHSKARVVGLRSDLAQASKEGLTGVQLYLKVKRIADELRLAGLPLSHEEFLSHILSGLGKDYEAMIQLVTAPNANYTPDEVFALLLSTEARFKRYDQATPTMGTSSGAITSPQANYARSNAQQPADRGYRSNNTQPQQQQQRSDYHGNNYRGTNYNNNNYRGRGGRNYRGGRSNNRSGDPSVQCQICAKFGHVAKECYYRYTPSSDPQAIQPPRRPPPPPPQAYHTYQPYHAYPLYQSAYPPPSAAYNPYPYPSADWVPDTGATHHFTNDPRNLNLASEPYDGPEKVHVGDGAGLPGSRPT